jgi:hypothetical protein
VGANKVELYGVEDSVDTNGMVPVLGIQSNIPYPTSDFKTREACVIL